MSQDQVDMSMLDGTLDDLADLPEFKPFPSGAYTVALTFTEKVINKKPTVEMKMKLLTIEEMADGVEEANIPKDGAESNVLFILKNNDGTPNEIAQGQLKKILQKLGPVFGGSSMREIMTNANNATVGVVLKAKTDKEGTLRQQVVDVLVG